MDEIDLSPTYLCIIRTVPVKTIDCNYYNFFPTCSFLQILTCCLNQLRWAPSQLRFLSPILTKHYLLVIIENTHFNHLFPILSIRFADLIPIINKIWKPSFIDRDELEITRCVLEFILYKSSFSLLLTFDFETSISKLRFRNFDFETSISKPRFSVHFSCCHPLYSV